MTWRDLLTLLDVGLALVRRGVRAGLSKVVSPGRSEYLPALEKTGQSCGFARCCDAAVNAGAGFGHAAAEPASAW